MISAAAAVSRRLQRVASGNYLWQAKIASLALWRSWDKYVSTPSKPLARIGLRLEEFLHVHFAMRAARAAESSSAKQGILFRGVEYDIERQNHTSSNLRRPFPSCLQVKTPRYLFVLHQEEEESLVGIAQQVEEKGKIKIFYDGCTAMRTFTKYAPVQAAPSAHGELGYAKFTYCHIVMHFLSRCTACATRVRCQRDAYFCKPCEQGNDLELYLTAEEAASEFFLTEEEMCNSELVRTRVCRVGSKVARLGGTEHMAASSRKAEAVRYYREIDVAHLAVLKWGGLRAIVRKRVAAVQQETACQLQAAPARGSGEAASKRKGKRAAEETSQVDYPKQTNGLGTKQAKNVAPSAHSVLPTTRKRKPRKASEGKNYAEDIPDEIDTRRGVSSLASVFNWHL